MTRRITTLSQRVARRLALAAFIAVLLQSIWAVWSYRSPDEHSEMEEDAVEWVLDALGARLQTDGTVDHFYPERYNFASIRYAVLDPAGNRLDGTLAVEPEVARQASRIHEMFLVDARPGGNRWIGARRTFQPDRQPRVIVAEVVFRRGVQPLNILVAEVVESALFPTFPVIVLMYVVGVFAIRGSLLGLKRAAREARALDPRRRGRRLSEEGLPAEVLSLVRAVNDGIAALEHQLAEQQAFAGEVAHELRTPLAILRLEVDRLDGPVAARLREDVAALSRRIDQLLASARAGALRLEGGERADLAEIAADVVGRYAPIAMARKVRLALEGEGPVAVMGDATAIGAALLNIVENAARVTPPGGTVRVQVGPGPEVAVLDEGPGIDPAVREQLFEPYRRGDARGPGTGLGLFIVRRTMEAHGGAVALHNRPGGGARAVLRFRAALAAGKQP
ncbi:sensor histidine kinase [Pedomonas sp. V897]|uniref:sensor histidine kinase n=1 Tax=Pedomonas sp. V897 TaxID=3446482 RepID=UPI003EDFB294